MSSLVRVAAPTDFGGPRRLVAVLGTGGTIAQSGSREATLGVEQLAAGLGPGSGDVELRCEQVFQLVSPDVTPAHWIALARRVEAVLGDPDIAGVVITHGTDTLEETACFLDLTIRTDKPVVFAGAMRRADAVGADGPRNLANAIAVAASPQARGMGVLVTLNDSIEAARDVTKTNTMSVDAFRSPEAGPLGHVRSGIVSFGARPFRDARPIFPLPGTGELPLVEIVYGYAGLGRSAFDGARHAGARGIVVAGTGAGGLPRALHPVMRELREAGIAVVRSSRVNAGPVARNAEVDDDALDLVAAGSLNPQKARVLLILALTRTARSDEIQRLFDAY